MEQLHQTKSIKYGIYTLLTPNPTGLISAKTRYTKRFTTIPQKAERAKKTNSTPSTRSPKKNTKKSSTKIRQLKFGPTTKSDSVKFILKESTNTVIGSSKNLNSTGRKKPSDCCCSFSSSQQYKQQQPKMILSQFGLQLQFSSL